VLLSFGLPFAIIPLIMFTSRSDIMGVLVNHRLTNLIAWLIASVVVALNIFLIYQTFFGG
jgi:manganese transport protein